MIEHEAVHQGELRFAVHVICYAKYVHELVRVNYDNLSHDRAAYATAPSMALDCERFSHVAADFAQRLFSAYQ